MSPKKCKEIQTLLQYPTHFQRGIACIAGVLKVVMHRIKIKIDKKKPLEADRKGKCGRERITTLRSGRKIRNIGLETHKKSLTCLITTLKDEGTDVSKGTSRRIQAEESVIACGPISRK